MAAERTLAFCSAHNRYVPALVTARPDVGQIPSPVDGESIVCLDYRVRCSGAMCPLFTCMDEYPEELREALPAHLI